MVFQSCQSGTPHHFAFEQEYSVVTVVKIMMLGIHMLTDCWPVESHSEATLNSW
jgi:hypothetical protein